MWEFLPDSVPDDFQQAVMRRPYFARKCRESAFRDEEYKDDFKFAGWRWVCPGCRKEVRTIYYPVAPWTMFDHFYKDLARSDVDEMPLPPPTFACWHCHGVQGFIRVRGNGWNQVVTVLTRGLLYGHEVQKPAWYKEERRRRRDRKLNRRAPKREAVLRRLLNGWSDKRIARDLMMSLGSMRNMRRELCRQERVVDREELAKKLGSPHAQPMDRKEMARERRRRVMELLLEGLSYDEICRKGGLTRRILVADATWIYRKHGLGKREGRKGLAKKLGVELPARFAVKRR